MRFGAAHFALVCEVRKQRIDLMGVSLSVLTDFGARMDIAAKQCEKPI